MQQPMEGHHHKDHHKKHEAEAAGECPNNEVLCILYIIMTSQYQVRSSCCT